MIIPQYWAEGRVQQRINGRQVTVRRFGWSDASQDEAQQQADTRARQAFERVAAGDAKVLRREPKVAYNGAEGVPIREEIVERHGEAVVTRNAYGARCLNTPDVLFVDVDLNDAPNRRLTVIVTVVLLAAAIGLGLWRQSWMFGGVLVLAALVFGHFFAGVLNALINAASGGTDQRMRRRVKRFLARHPDWHLRLYRTPAGYRVLALHRCFDPAEPAVAECFQALGADPLYVRMCLNQRCFRARVSAKPWRIGITAHLKPRPGVWPIAPDRLPERERWVAAYEQAARGYAACRFMEAQGSSAVAFEARAVQLIHDELGGAGSALPVA